MAVRQALTSVLLAAAMGLGALPLSAAPAAALCGGPLPSESTVLASAGPDTVVLIGTVAETRGARYNALIHVEEVWLGGPVNEWMTLRGSSDESWFAVQEDVPMWAVGVRYLLRAQRDGNDLRSTTCSYTVRWEDSFIASRPSTASAPIASFRPLLWEWQPLFQTLLVPAAVVLLVLTLIGLVLRRRSPRRTGG